MAQSISVLDAQAGCQQATDELIHKISNSINDIQTQVAASRAEIVRTRELLDRLGYPQTSGSSEAHLGVRWHLATSRSLEATCSISEEAAGLFRVVVSGAERNLIVEDFASARGASTRATQIGADLVRLGWMEQRVI